MERVVFNRFDKNTKLRLAKFDLASRASVNMIRFDPASGLNHKKGVIGLAQEALQRGEHFITRARLDPRACGEELVADFYNIDWNTVHEVADSENKKSIERKEKLWRSLGFHFQVVTTHVT